MSPISGVAGAFSLSGAGQASAGGRGHAQRKADFESALTAAGADPSKVSTIESQIQAAIKSARSGASDSGNSRAAVQTAIDTVLKNNGVDASKFQAAIRSQHPHHAPQPSSGSTPVDADGDNDGSQAQTGTGTTGIDVLG